MMRYLIFLLALSMPAASQQPVPVQVSVPSPFDENTDARNAIKSAVDSAALDGIRVLIAWGANEDSGTKAFLDAKRAPAISAQSFFRDEYKSVSISVGHMDRNLDLAKNYGVILKAEALPALTVLDSAGKVLANTNAAALRPDRDPAGIDPVKVAAFLKLHQSPAPDAIAPFETALKQAKKEDKDVFLWFSAPW